MGDRQRPDPHRFAVVRLPGQVLFGAGSLRSVPLLAVAHGTRMLICTDPTMAASAGLTTLLADLGHAGFSVAVFDRGVPELPLSVIDESVRMAEEFQPDVILGFGGGSSIDLAKATALLLRYPGPLSQYYGEHLVPGPVCPVIAVPTTSGTGSEVTPVAVVSDPEHELKVGISSPFLIPTYAVCDPQLVIGCPPSVTAHAGIDALAHAVEAITASEQTPLWSERLPVFVGSNSLGNAMSLQSISAIGSALRVVMADPGNEQARASMAYGSMCAGISFGAAGTHLAHALQYAVGAATHTPHGLGVGLLLPYVLQATRSGCLPALAAVGEALGLPVEADPEDAAQNVIAEIHALCADIGLPQTLKDLGVERAVLPTFAAQTAAVTRLVRNAPVRVDEDLLREILEAAWSGDRARLVSM